MTPAELRALPAVFVDLETTGFSVDHDRAIEVAAVRYEQGQPVRTYQQLLDPRLAIPPRVERLTGISDAMVRGQPTLEDCLGELIDLLDGALLVAHNLPFDYGFLRRAAAIARVELAPSRLCSLKLTRRALPKLRSHRLDALARELGLPAEQLHRALPHVRQTAEIFHWILERVSDDVLIGCLEQGPVPTRARVDDAGWKDLPSGPGVYLLKDSDGHVVYVGKSANVRRRVREHLRQRWHPQPRLRREMRRVTQVEAVSTETDLEALFLESRLIKRYQPDGNSAERRERLAAFVSVSRSEPYPRIRVVDGPHAAAEELFGPFGSRVRLEEGLRALFDAVGLCPSVDPEQCRPVIPRHCLGPCGLHGAPSQYCDAFESALSLLRGDDRSLLDYLRQRRDHEADGLNFETAAALRDRIYALERLVGDERWRRDVRTLTAVLVLPAEEPTERKLVFFRTCRLVGTVRVRLPVEATELNSIMQTHLLASALPVASPHEVVEEMRLIQGWMRRVKDKHPLVHVQPARIEQAAIALGELLRNPVASSSVRS